MLSESLLPHASETLFDKGTIKRQDLRQIYKGKIFDILI